MSTTHILDFVCEGYTGNFEHELFSYVFGQGDYDRPQRDFSQYLTQDERDRAEELYEDFFEGWHGEYGWTIVEVETAKLGDIQESANSVRTRIHDEAWRSAVTPELIEEWKARAAKFFDVYREHLPAYRTGEGKFLGLVHSTSTVVVTPGETL